MTSAIHEFEGWKTKLPSRLTGGFFSWRVATGLFLILLSLIYSGSSLKCFHCLEQPRSNEKHLSCAYFDRSSKFHKHCNHSTFCMKKTSIFQLHNGTYVTIYVHKCADQAHRTMLQDKITGDWNWANLLRYDLYNEGCEPHHSPSSLLTTDTSHCFCSSDFCNLSSLGQVPSKSLIMISAVATVFWSYSTSKGFGGSGSHFQKSSLVRGIVLRR